MRIVLVEDHLAYLDSFKLAIATLSSIEVVGQAARPATPSRSSIRQDPTWSFRI